MSSFDFDDIMGDLLGVTSPSHEVSEDLDVMEEIAEALDIQISEDDIYETTTSLIDTKDITYPFLYIYPYRYQCETERLAEITKEDKSSEDEKINVMAPLGEGIAKVGRFKLCFDTMYKLFQFNAYKLILVESENSKIQIDVETLFSTLVEV